MLLLAAGNWEVWIASCNLQARFRSIDIGFLLDVPAMPGRVLPTLLARRALIDAAPRLTAEAEYGGAEVIPAAEAQRRLAAAVATWKSRYQAQPSWQGRAYSDWRTAQALQVQ